MNFFNFITKIKQIKKDNCRYYYLEYSENKDDIKKYYTVLIGLTSLEESIITDHEYIRIESLDENNEISSKLHGYSCCINCNLKVNISYKISGEYQGNHIKDDIIHIHRGELSSHLKRINYYTTNMLSKKRMINEFWKYNRDWLINL